MPNATFAEAWLVLDMAQPLPSSQAETLEVWRLNPVDPRRMLPCAVKAARPEGMRCSLPDVSARLAGLYLPAAGSWPLFYGRIPAYHISFPESACIGRGCAGTLSFPGGRRLLCPL